MNLLLDTHALLWALSAPRQLAAQVRELIERPDTTVLVSVVSAWEMEIKRALGKLDVPDDLETQLKRLRFQELPVRLRHVQRLRQLPDLHRDPFDRMLVAQAMVDGLTLITRDRDVMAYPVKSMRC
jgi:PIN domain nuclease of toxin-antitoxin system